MKRPSYSPHGLIIIIIVYLNVWAGRGGWRWKEKLKHIKPRSSDDAVRDAEVKGGVRDAWALACSDQPLFIYYCWTMNFKRLRVDR
jgi:hypothetical protein